MASGRADSLFDVVSRPRELEPSSEADLRFHPLDLADAARAWLHFDNWVEPPHPDAPYEEHVRYETQKAKITEAVAAALGDGK